MSLADVPLQTPCVVTSPGDPADQSLFRVIGVGRGVNARVLARYPEAAPAFAEIELEGVQLVTLPLATARALEVELVEKREVPK